MIASFHSPSDGFSKNSEVERHKALVREMHHRENSLLQSEVGNDEALKVIGAFFDTYVIGAFCDFRVGACVDHSVWRLLENSQYREAAITLCQFLDPMAVGVEQAALVAIIARFVDADDTVRAFLESVRDGDAMGLMVLNDAARSKADECLSRTGDKKVVVPTQEEDLQLFV